MSAVHTVARCKNLKRLTVPVTGCATMLLYRLFLLTPTEPCDRPPLSSDPPEMDTSALPSLRLLVLKTPSNSIDTPCQQLDSLLVLLSQLRAIEGAYLPLQPAFSTVSLWAEVGGREWLGGGAVISAANRSSSNSRSGSRTGT